MPNLSAGLRFLGSWEGFINKKNNAKKIQDFLKKIKNEIIAPNQAFLEVVKKIEIKIDSKIISWKSYDNNKKIWIYGFMHPSYKS